MEKGQVQGGDLRSWDETGIGAIAWGIYVF